MVVAIGEKEEKIAKLAKQREAQQRYRQRHPDRIKDDNKKRQTDRNAYYWRNRDRILANRKAYDKKYNEEHRGEKSRKNKDKYWANHDEMLLYNRKKRRQIKYDVLSHYSSSNVPMCERCGIKDIDVLCIDHINNDGYKQGKDTTIRKSLHSWLKQNNYPGGYQVLCANCNLKKRIQHLEAKYYETHQANN